MIIDSYAHLGTCRVFGANQTAEDLIGAMDAGGIDTSVVQPFPGTPDTRAAYDAIASLAEQHPGRIVGMASIDPHQDRDAYHKELQRCVHELGFRAVKVHTIGHSVKPGSEDADLIFATAAELGIAVMIHTGPGVPFAEPAAWIPMARQYPETPVILGDAGASLYTGPAIVAAQVCDNVVFETSWCNPQDLRAAVRTLGAERILFGSDMTFNVKVELAKYEAAGLTDEQRKLVFATNAQRVLSLSEADAREAR